MRLFSWLRRRRASETVEDATRAIRGHFAALGYDLSEFTDEEVENAVLRLSARFGEIARATGVAARQAAETLVAIVQGRQG